jgi:quercetin dioxygenase-like cupin family protein
LALHLTPALFSFLLPCFQETLPMSRCFPTPAERRRHDIFPGVCVETCISADLMLSLATLQPASVVPLHSHLHEQVGVVLEGRVIFRIGDEEKTLGPGDTFCIPGNVPHRVVALDQTAKVLDVFHPIRDDYR